MIFTAKYSSPLGEILLASDEIGLTGLWFHGQKYFAENLDPFHEEKENDAIKKAKVWLDEYFKGQRPDLKVPLHLRGTKFQLQVWAILQNIPYGNFMTYKEIAAIIAKEQGIKQMSAQAVGGAVGHNPISIIIPCHRVIGSNKSLTGYAGGLDKKLKLLTLEKADTTALYMPKN